MSVISNQELRDTSRGSLAKNGAVIERLKASVVGRPEAVDRKANILRGYVVAQLGAFKTDGRGEFDDKSLDSIERLGNAGSQGVKSRLGHPTMSESGVGKFLGRAHDFRRSTAVDARTGKKVRAVRADLNFDPSANKTPSGDLASYVLDLAESDPDALSSSLVLEMQEEMRIKKDGTLETDGDGNPLPPLWRPTKLHASDIVDTGDAVDGLLSAELTAALSAGEIHPKLLSFDRVARLATQLLDGQFRGKGREHVQDRCSHWLSRYLNLRFGEPVGTPRLDLMHERILRLRQCATNSPR